MEESRSIGPLTKDHVEGLKGLLDLYKSAGTWVEMFKSKIHHGLCFSIREHIGVDIYDSDEFRSFIGNHVTYLCKTPSLCRNLDFNEVRLICIQPRVEALEKIINHLNQ